MENLVFDMLAEVCSYVSQKDLVTMSQVSATWNKAFSIDELWTNKMDPDVRVLAVAEIPEDIHDTCTALPHCLLHLNALYRLWQTIIQITTNNDNDIQSRLTYTPQQTITSKV